jgi:hypothetical protein
MLMRRSTGIGSSLPVSFSPLLSLHNLLAVGAESVKLPGPSEHGLNDRVRSQPRGDVELQDAPRFRPRSTELQRALRRILLFPAVVTDGRHLPPDLLQVLTEDPVSGEHLCRPEGERNPALISPSLPIGKHGADDSVWPPGPSSSISWERHRSQISSFASSRTFEAERPAGDSAAVEGGALRCSYTRQSSRARSSNGGTPPALSPTRRILFDISWLFG